MPTLEIIEVSQPPDSWTLKNGPAAGQEMHTYTVRAKGPDGEQTYQINRKPTSGPPEMGADEYEITPPKPGTSFPPKIKKVYRGGGGGGGGMPPERQRAIQRQHSQEMALRLIEIQVGGKGQVNKDELTYWADWFDADVNRVAGADVGGGSTHGEVARVSHEENAADVSAPSTAQKRAITTALNKGGVSKDFQATIVHSFADPLTKQAATRILDILCDESLGNPEQRVEALLRESGLERGPGLPEPDQADLEPAVVGPADDIPFAPSVI